LIDSSDVKRGGDSRGGLGLHTWWGRFRGRFHMRIDTRKGALRVPL
jgi:hypothetical protein